MSTTTDTTPSTTAAVGSLDPAELTARLRELIAEHDVPAASVAVLTPDGTTTAAAGVLNRGTGVEATTDSLFQIGSITKLYTAALVGRLVERGALALDEPVRTYLPDFQVSDPAASTTVTLRHLLTHTSGIDGDHFEDTGRGDDVLAKYVASCAGLAQQFPVGATMSYCNAGFSVLGRVLEVVTGQVWDQVLQNELVAPLGLERTVTLPEDVLRYRAACGHVGEPGKLTVTPQWGMPRSLGPAGLVCASAEDVLGFAEPFLQQGCGPDGQPWLSPDTVTELFQPQVAVPDRWTLGAHWGVGWILYQEAGPGHPLAVVGHDGATLGQSACLRLVPERGVAVALLMNGGATGDLANTLLRELLDSVAGAPLPPRLTPVPGADGGDRSNQVGRYVRAAATLTVAEHGDRGLTLTMVDTSELAHVHDDDAVRVDLEPVEQDVYVGRLPGTQNWTPAVFFQLDDGSRYLHLGARATRRSQP